MARVLQTEERRSGAIKAELAATLLQLSQKLHVLEVGDSELIPWASLTAEQNPLLRLELLIDHARSRADS